RAVRLVHCTPLLSATRCTPRSSPFPYTTLFRSHPPSPWPCLRQVRRPVLASEPQPVLNQWAMRLPVPVRRRPGSRPHRNRQPHRSEEHTSELQSHLNLVCRLLLEKKKQKRKQTT